MADVITFSCTQCQMPFRVAVSNVGRGFVCKNCGKQLVVPSASTPMAPVVVPQEPQVQLDAGEQVIRKTDSARRASVDPTRMITRNSGAHPAVVPPPQGAYAPPPAKSKTPMIAGAVAIGVVLLVVVGLAVGGVFSGSKPVAPQGNSPTAQGPTNEVKKEAGEREKILAELLAPGRTGPSMIEVYKRAVAANLDKTEQASVARDAADRIASENGQGLTDDAVLDFAQLLAGKDYVTEPARLYQMIARRYVGKPDPPPAFERAQKLRKLDKVDFAALLSRADAVVESGVIETADALRAELVKMQEASEAGWVDSASAARFAEIGKELDTQQAEVDRIQREDPFQFVAARSRRAFNTQRVSTRSAWGVHASDPVIIYYERHKGEEEDYDQRYYAESIAGIEQFVAFFRKEFIEPMGLRRSLPQAIKDADERERAPLEILLFHERSSWRPYISDVKARVDTNRQNHLTEQASGRLSYLHEGTEASLVNLMTMLTHHCIETWHPRAKETKDKPSFQTYVIETILPANISLCKRTPDGDSTKFEFYHHDTRWQRQLGVWRKPFAAQPNGSIDSFGGPGVTLRDLVKVTGANDFVDAFEKNIRTYAGWDDQRIKGVVDAMRLPNSQPLNVVLGGYFRAFGMFLWHFEKDGKPKYRDGFRRFLLADLEGKVKDDVQVEEFQKALKLDEAGWKQIEAEFLAYQTAP